jgi:hypothetical protein
LNDVPDGSGVFLCGDGHFLSIFLRQETRFLPGFTSGLHHAIASRDFSSGSACWDGWKES